MYFEKLCNLFLSLNEIEAIALGGSRATGCFDKNSDYDLYIYCSRIPVKENRNIILQQCCDRIELNNTFFETEDDCTLKNGIDIDIIYRDLSSFANDVADVAKRHSSRNGYTTCMWYNLVNSKIIYDRNNSLKELQKEFSIPYPEELKTNIIKRNYDLLTGNLPSYDKQILKACSRGDTVSINHRVSAFIESYFDIIFALNSLLHPGEKRMVEYALKHAKTLPHNFQENLNMLFTSMFTDVEKTKQILNDICFELKKIM
ncbi:MAG: DUF4037 domain-containing protein [Succinivibrio sp.]